MSINDVVRYLVCLFVLSVSQPPTSGVFVYVSVFFRCVLSSYVCLFMCLCLFVYLLVCFFYLSVSQLPYKWCVCLRDSLLLLCSVFICLFVCVYEFVCLFVCLFVCFLLFVSQSASLQVVCLST